MRINGSGNSKGNDNKERGFANLVFSREARRRRSNSNLRACFPASTSIYCEWLEWMRFTQWLEASVCKPLASRSRSCHCEPQLQHVRTPCQGFQNFQPSLSQKVSYQELKTFVSSVLDLDVCFITTESSSLFRLPLPEEVHPLKTTHTSLADAYVRAKRGTLLFCFCQAWGLCSPKRG
jgi:hypothetical protein